MNTVLTDCLLWAIGQRSISAIISVVAHEPRRLAQYKACIPRTWGLVHVTVEVHAWPRILPKGLQLAARNNREHARPSLHGRILSQR